MGTLYIVSTPIGNLGDITSRAIKTLSEVDAVLAEDTRVSGRLLSHFNINKPVIAFHDFNKEKAAPHLIERMLKDESFALISDAGTPGIADEAFYLVREAVKNGITVSPLPGASAVTSALVCSGLPCDRYIFENFIPVKSGRRRSFLENFRSEKRTVIFFESPYRIQRTLAEMKDVLGDISVVIAREITKIHEEFLRGTPAKLLEHFNKHPPKGEFVVMMNCMIQITE